MVWPSFSSVIWPGFHNQQCVFPMVAIKPCSFTIFTRHLTIFYLPFYCINKEAKNMAWLYRHSADCDLARNCNRHYLAMFLPKPPLFTLRRRHDPLILLSLVYRHFATDCPPNPHQNIQNLLDYNPIDWRNNGRQASSHLW